MEPTPSPLSALFDISPLVRELSAWESRVRAEFEAQSQRAKAAEERVSDLESQIAGLKGAVDDAIHTRQQLAGAFREYLEEVSHAQLVLLTITRHLLDADTVDLRSEGEASTEGDQVPIDGDDQPQNSAAESSVLTVSSENSGGANSGTETSGSGTSGGVTAVPENAGTKAASQGAAAPSSSTRASRKASAERATDKPHVVQATIVPDVAPDIETTDEHRLLDFCNQLDMDRLNAPSYVRSLRVRY